ncbi:hypothetical protein GCK72_003370 [Caenorhabditis remanei]|uniref:Uncharacterized protein n=1 Tax=Caenorhabditis remanei TaxID=31234 RepID=A0A6A5HY45_CAERE|nr:hypothetical protein GCK72_003370 [Caenorhabditis remanei]KAF1771543.1 hypothetical protein GCK72_003370 [Caenorhabditis remanei]
MILLGLLECSSEKLRHAKLNPLDSTIGETKCDGDYKQGDNLPSWARRVNLLEKRTFSLQQEPRYLFFKSRDVGPAMIFFRQVFKYVGETVEINQEL